MCVKTWIFDKTLFHGHQTERRFLETNLVSVHAIIKTGGRELNVFFLKEVYVNNELLRNHFHRIQKENLAPKNSIQQYTNNFVLSMKLAVFFF